MELLDSFFDVARQIPPNFFKDVPGFNETVFLKLKSTIENLQIRINFEERTLKNLELVKEKTVNPSAVKPGGSNPRINQDSTSSNTSQNDTNINSKEYQRVEEFDLEEVPSHPT